MIELARLDKAIDVVRRDVLAARNDQGHWTGRLASSALSTATASSALSLYLFHKQRPAVEGSSDAAPKLDVAELGPSEDFDPVRIQKRIDAGLVWLTTQQNADGGWGDTDLSFSNIATTFLVKAAFHMAGQVDAHSTMLAKADVYLAAQGGVDGLRKRYGKDKTFAVPILTNCALAGLVDWSQVSPLPFELACMPQHWFKHLQLPVVSYALPALIAIGQARYHHRKPWNPVMRWARAAAVEPSLKVLRRIQPASGGFLEATPLTSFVTMSLVSCGRADHAVARHGVRFLVESARPDGSWPIDTNLATWNTTLSINALAEAGYDVQQLGDRCWRWLDRCQQQTVHPYTGADPGGWGWSDLSGSVPDADDTPGALLALAHRRDAGAGGQPGVSAESAAELAVELADSAGRGIAWLLNLQNNDGGWPTFCKGWGALPFDRSGSDLTAHALRAFAAWMGRLAPSEALSPEASRAYQRFEVRMAQAVEQGFRYLAKRQKADGSWEPLWFGNQYQTDEENPIYGTAKVLFAYRDLGRSNRPEADKAAQWLAAQQNPDGGWGRAAPSAEDLRGPNPRDKSAHPPASSVEETALAVEALAGVYENSVIDLAISTALERGVAWLVQQVEGNRHRKCSPIGFYFAKLWYYETTYPLAFMLSALGRVRQALHVGHNPQKGSALPTARV